MNPHRTPVAGPGLASETGFTVQSCDMLSWLDPVSSETPNREQRALQDGVAEILERLRPSRLDPERSSATLKSGSLGLDFAHRTQPELGILVTADGAGEIVVSYGEEHEHFTADDAAHGRVWPFPCADHLEAALSLIEGLMSGRVELQVWRRPLAVRTRSYWCDDRGRPQLFLRASSLGPYVGWRREPEIRVFDYR
jgi:hypothetical protein